MTKKPAKKSPEERRKEALMATAKYGGMAFELLGACLAGALIGRWVDAKMEMERPLFAVFLTILFLFVAFYMIYKQLLKD
ncbi:MAG: AtpZ/AtpI family protein [Saprospiraceae bacterium]|nr:AtpZ/AtpI family protein [Saprospiraceae bacterium]MCB9343438.1 AtpZ/AtpI family protein [Lewinellaceae bacterium]